MQHQIYASAQEWLKQFLRKNSTALHWIMFLLIFQCLEDQFLQNHGCLRVTSEAGQFCLTIVARILICFIICRLIQPNQADDIKAFFLALLLPVSGFVWAVGLFGLEILLIFFRWHWTTRILAIIFILTYTAYPQAIESIQGCNLASHSNIWPEYGKLLCSRDRIYQVYQFGPYRALFRKIDVLPGVSLVKRIYSAEQSGLFEITRTANGEYILTPGHPF